MDVEIIHALPYWEADHLCSIAWGADLSTMSCDDSFEPWMGPFEGQLHDYLDHCRGNKPFIVSLGD